MGFFPFFRCPSTPSTNGARDLCPLCFLPLRGGDRTAANWCLSPRSEYGDALAVVVTRVRASEREGTSGLLAATVFRLAASFFFPLLFRKKAALLPLPCSLSLTCPLSSSAHILSRRPTTSSTRTAGAVDRSACPLWRRRSRTRHAGPRLARRRSRQT